VRICIYIYICICMHIHIGARDDFTNEYRDDYAWAGMYGVQICVYVYICAYVGVRDDLTNECRELLDDDMYGQAHPIAIGVQCNLILQSQSNWCLFNGTRQRRRREPENRLRID